MSLRSKAAIINFTLIGPPGSGKGTYGKMAASALKSTFLSAGDLLRNIVDPIVTLKDELSSMSTSSSLIGHQIRVFQEKGELISDELVEKIILDHLVSHNRRHDHVSTSTTGYILVS